MKRTPAVVVLVSISLLAVSPVTAAGQARLTPATVVAVQAWTRAVERHEAGRRDESVAAVTSTSFEARRELRGGISLFLSTLLSERVLTTSEPGRRIEEMGLAAQRNPGPAEFLKRAALLHADAAMSGDPIPAPPRDSGDVPPGDSPASALISVHRLFLNKDGEVLGGTFSNWNWPFARNLLDLLPLKPGGDPFVALWYHATTAYMLKNGLYGEVGPQLSRAAIILPNEPRLLFDRACYAETLGLPIKQVLRSDEDLRALHAGRSFSSSAIRLGIPLEDETNAQAERLFRRTLEIQPGFVEARVRLARLLNHRGRNDESVAELRVALAAGPTGTVAFYAHLFAGRAVQALGRVTDASGEFRAALALFPSAQSALLAQSQAALLDNDLPGTLAPIAHLDAPASARDPWWEYHLGAGREATDLLRAMWTVVPR